MVCAAKASSAEFNADRSPWYRPWQRDKLQAEASEQTERGQRAQAEAAELARQTAALQDQLPKNWRSAPDRAELAAASYQQDQEAAQQKDDLGLQLLANEITTRSTSAEAFATHHTDLLTEQQLRATMPDQQHALEDGWRTEWHHQQWEHQRAEQQQIERLDSELDYHARIAMDHEIDHGHGLGY